MGAISHKLLGYTVLTVSNQSGQISGLRTVVYTRSGNILFCFNIYFFMETYNSHFLVMNSFSNIYSTFYEVQTIYEFLIIKYEIHRLICIIN